MSPRSASVRRNGLADPDTPPEEDALDATETCLPHDFTVPFETHVTVVAGDPETGSVSVERYLAVDDAGEGDRI